MNYVLTCEAATSGPVITGSVVDACTDAGGVVAWIEAESALPGLTLEGGGQIAVAIVALWALAWAFRSISRQLKED